MVFTSPHAGDSRSHAASRVIRRNTNRRHMLGDHHGRSARRATLLVSATDGILGTHTLIADGSSDNTGVSAIVHRPTAHATEATWRACLVSPLAASALATVASVCACRSGLAA